MDPADDYIFSSIWPLLTDEEWNQLFNESFQNGVVPYLHPLDLDDEVEGSWLDLPLPDQPGGNRDHISIQNSLEPDHPGKNEVSQSRIQTEGKNSLGPDYIGINSIFSSCLPLFTDEEWNWLENESYQYGSQVSCLYPIGFDYEVEGSWLDPPVPDQPGSNGNDISHQISQDLDHPGETEVGQFRIQTVGTNSLGPECPGLDLEVEIEVRDDGVEGSRLDLPVPDELEGNPDHISSQIDPDHPGENEIGQFRIQTVGTNSLGPEHPGPDSEAEPEGRDDGVEGARHDPSVPDKPGGNGDYISGQIPQEPDHLGESEVGQFRVQAIRTNSLGPEYPGKDQERESFHRRPERASPGLAPEASCNLRKQRSKPPRLPELAPVVSGAAANPQNLPRQQSTQDLGRPKDTRGLPEGWITEVKVRKEGHSAGHKDKTYRELSTNKRCRSIPDVWRYMEKKRKL